MRLPVRNEAVPDWVGAQNAQQELETANNNIESRKRWLMANPGVIAFSASHDLPDNLIAKSTAEASYLQKKINDLTRSADSTEARYLLWIELPVRERCRALDQLLCRNGDQLSAMHQLMLQQRP